jgi:hypothetical protein
VNLDDEIYDDENLVDERPIPHPRRASSGNPGALG